MQISNSHELKLPLISVIIPVYNGAKMIEEALSSVFDQSYPNLEIIVVDDGSTDGTATILKKYPTIKYFYQENRGPASARNIGFSYSQGQYIAFLDADDLFPKDKLLNQYQILKADDSLIAVRGLIQWENLGEKQHSIDQVFENSEAKTNFNVNLGAFLFRRGVFEKIGLLDETLIYHEDTDFWNRLKIANIKIKNSREIGLIYRIHADNMTHDKKAFGKGMIRAFMKKKNLLEKQENTNALKIKSKKEVRIQQITRTKL